MSKKLTNEEFIKRAREVHGDKYDYSKVEYVNADTKVCIICPNHGEFWQIPSSHLRGIGCKKCGYEKNANNMKDSTESFIEKAKNIHGDKYDYSKVEYIDSHTKVSIVCPIHGVFHVLPYSHLNGSNCPKCAHRSYKYDTEEFIERAKSVHGNKYDYSKVEYTNNSTKVCIVCPKHGEFWQTPQGHLSGKGCKKCKGKNKTTDEFINEIKSIHGNKYDCSKVKYINAKIKVCVICPEHGEFWIRPNDILNRHGCPKCCSSMLENNTRNFLESKNINYVQQCSKHDFDWLDRQSLDFYLPQYKIAIECQGEQHFKPIEYFGGKKKLLYVQSLDRRKKNLCEGHGIKLYYINYDEDVETKLEEILEEHVAVH